MSDRGCQLGPTRKLKGLGILMNETSGQVLSSIDPLVIGFTRYRYGDQPVNCTVEHKSPI